MAKDKVLSKYAHQRRFKVGDRVGFSFLGDTRYGIVEDMKRKDQYYIYYVRCNSTLYNLGEEGITGHGHVIDFEEPTKVDLEINTSGVSKKDSVNKVINIYKTYGS